MNQRQEPIINLSLPLSAVNRLLEGAAQLPYAAVAPLIHEVQQQADAQLKQQEEPKAPEPAAAAAA